MDRIFIHKSDKSGGGFAQIANRLFEDRCISLRLKGLLGYALSKPPDWKLNIRDIVNHTAEGKKAVESTIDEGIRSGYMRRLRITDDRGRILEWQLHVYETPEAPPLLSPDDGAVCSPPDGGNPVLDCPHLVKPQVDRPQVAVAFLAQPHVADRPPTNNESTKMENDEETTTTDTTAKVVMQPEVVVVFDLLKTMGMDDPTILQWIDRRGHKQVTVDLAFLDWEIKRRIDRGKGKISDRRGWLIRYWANGGMPTVEFMKVHGKATAKAPQPPPAPAAPPMLPETSPASPGTQSASEFYGQVERAVRALSDSRFDELHKAALKANANNSIFIRRLRMNPNREDPRTREEVYRVMTEAEQCVCSPVPAPAPAGAGTGLLPPNAANGPLGMPVNS